MFHAVLYMAGDTKDHRVIEVEERRRRIIRVAGGSTLCRSEERVSAHGHASEGDGPCDGNLLE